MEDLMNDKNLDALQEFIASSNDVDLLVKQSKALRAENAKLYSVFLEKLKLLFVLSDDYNFYSTCALLFSELKVHSSVHLIVAKLLSGNLEEHGSVLLNSLFGLKKKAFEHEIRTLWKKPISWEMKQHLVILGIYEGEANEK